MNEIDQIKKQIYEKAQQAIKGKAEEFKRYAMYQVNNVLKTQLAMSEQTIYHLKHIASLSQEDINIEPDGNHGFHIHVNKDKFIPYHCLQFFQKSIQNAVMKSKQSGVGES